MAEDPSIPRDYSITTILSMISSAMESNHMSHCTTMIFHRHSKMNMEDGKDLTNYADVCFREFGERLHRSRYREKQQGFVGITVYLFGVVPLTNTETDKAATQSPIVEPLVHGDYPIFMKKNAGARIPTFTENESRQVKGSFDFIGLICYTNFNVADRSEFLEQEPRDYDRDLAAELTNERDLFTDEELPVEPWGLQEEMNRFKLHYGNPPIFIYENGQLTASNASLQDVSRVKYLHGYIGAVLDVLRNGSNTIGYFAWSFLDLLELLDGYKSSFGLYYVDRNDPDLKRYAML